MIKGMNHCGIVVRNMDSAIDFYRDVIGLELLDQFERDSGPISEVVGYENTHLKVAFFDIGEGHKFELLEYINPPPSGRPTEERNVLGASHLAFNTDDAKETYKTLISKGAKGINPPVEVGPGKIACYFQDPDGNWLELIEMR